MLAVKKVKRTEFAKLLEKSGLDKQEVAESLGINIRTIYRWEIGETTPKKYVFDALSRIRKSTKGAEEKSRFRYIDLFAGIGGLRKGFDNIGGKCVFTSEWNLACRKTYHVNYHCDHPVEGDINKLPVEQIPEHDVLLAGFPCQPFSIAGVSKKNALGRAHGFLCESQGTLFFDVARIIAHHRPAAFLLENVKNLVSHNKGNTFKVIVQTLEQELDYNIDWRVINAKCFVPQNRERIFIAGFRKNTGFDFKKLELPDIEDGPIMSSVLHKHDGSESPEDPFTRGSRAIVNPKYTLSDSLWNYLQNYAAKHRAKGNGFGYGLVTPKDVARTLSARYYKDGSEILVKQKRKNPRRLTPRECARLMGFDKPGMSNFKIPVSDCQAYKQFGNSVVVPVVEAVADFMLPHIIDSMRSADGQKQLDFDFDESMQVKQVAHG